ncbi:translation initiation factor IF-2-like [Falco rusticolus]|uniref:translation initiation factor IF-2-like n=1 Tax=Falco rusticolus TaxID=120794 RepID=UPI0018866ADE|nr:translation initiation factor IF-2-like [Falco rusticolus]
MPRAGGVLPRLPHGPGPPPPSPHAPPGGGSPPPPDAWLSVLPLPDAWEPLGDPDTPASPPPGGPDTPAAPAPGGGSRRVLFADALGLPLTRLRQYRPWDPRGRGGVPGGGSGGFGGPCQGGEEGEGGEQPPVSWMRPGKGRLQEAEDVQPLPPDCSVEPDPSPTPPADVEQPPAQGSEEEAVARELEQLYLSHLRRLRGEPDDNGAPPPRNGGLPFPERAPNTSLANEMALRYEAGVGRHSPPVLLGGGGPVEGALVVPARPPRGRGLGGALRGCGVVLALAVLVPVAWGDGGGAHRCPGLGALPGIGLADMRGPPLRFSPLKAWDTPKSVKGGGGS